MAIFRFLVHAVAIEGLAVLAIVWFVSSSRVSAEASSTATTTASSVTQVADQPEPHLGRLFMETVPPPTERSSYVESKLKSAAESLAGAVDRLLERTINDVLN